MGIIVMCYPKHYVCFELICSMMVLVLQIIAFVWFCRPDFDAISCNCNTLD